MKEAYPEEGKLLLRCRRCGKEVEERLEVGEEE